jgi:hypothetical protein
MTNYLGKFGSGTYGDPGSDPTVLQGPTPASGTTGNGLLYPPMRLGTTMTGSEGTEFVLCKLVLAALTDMLPGEVYQWDREYLATRLTTATGVLNQEAGVGMVFSNQQAVGTYYIWLARAGHLPIRAAAASVATGYGESTATAGVLKFPASATASAFSVSPTSVYVASAGVTFTATTTNGSPTLTNISQTGIKDLALGAAIAGTGIPANANICAIRQTGSTFAIDIGTTTAAALTTLQNATASGSITVTATLTLPANVSWPTLNKLN